MADALPHRAARRAHGIGAWVVIACSTLTLQSCGGNDASETPASTSTPTSVEAPAGESVGTERAEAATEVSAGLRKALLDLPSVVERRVGDAWVQRPGGEIVVLERSEAAGGALRLRLRVAVERRDDPAAEVRRRAVVVDARTDAGGTPVAVRVVGEEDPEFLALFED